MSRRISPIGQRLEKGVDDIGVVRPQGQRNGRSGIRHGLGEMGDVGDVVGRVQGE
jgi:hypothetical protein